VSSDHLMLRHENDLRSRGIRTIAGVDEAGRGPLAGPVVAAAVLVFSGFFLPRVNDSKKLRPAIREELYGEILGGAAGVGVGIVPHDEIDRVNILNATMRAMEEAVGALPERPEFLLIDGNRYTAEDIPYATVVHGDALCFSVAAASIVAKVTRDRIMVEYDRLYPEYGFARHKGYGTQAHREAILRHGLSPIHRRTFTHRIVSGPA
jgi:ribonuclease HII